jgi:dipeptidyl aminopeptidase/acylaminoacyl peptidase
MFSVLIISLFINVILIFICIKKDAEIDYLRVKLSEYKSPDNDPLEYTCIELYIVFKQLDQDNKRYYDSYTYNKDECGDTLNEDNWEEFLPKDLKDLISWYSTPNTSPKYYCYKYDQGCNVFNIDEITNIYYERN